MTRRERLGVGLLVAVSCFIIGVLGSIALYRQPQISDNSSSSSSISSQSSVAEPIKTISIPFQNYSRTQWDEYGPGYDGKSFQEADYIWMRARGYITYLANISEITGTKATITARFCSELQKAYSTDAHHSSDTLLIVNGSKREMKNVIADNGIGRDYTWEVPINMLKAGTNEITFRVGDGRYSNGLAIFSPIQIRFIGSESRLMKTRLTH